MKQLPWQHRKGRASSRQKRSSLRVISPTSLDVWTDRAQLLLREQCASDNVSIPLEVQTIFRRDDVVMMLQKTEITDLRKPQRIALRFVSTFHPTLQRSGKKTVTTSCLISFEAELQIRPANIPMSQSLVAMHDFTHGYQWAQMISAVLQARGGCDHDPTPSSVKWTPVAVTISCPTDARRPSLSPNPKYVMSALLPAQAREKERPSRDSPPLYPLESRPTLHSHPAMMYRRRLSRRPVPCVAPLVSLHYCCPYYHLLALSAAFVVQGPSCRRQNYCQRCTPGQLEAPPLEHCPLCLAREDTAFVVAVFLCGSLPSKAPPSPSQCCRMM